MTLLQLRYLSISILIGIVFISCQKKSEKEAIDDEGFENIYTDDGTLLQKIKHINGDDDRIVRDYYKNGQLFQEVHYVHYKKQDILRKFYEDGKPYMITPYDSGKINGIEIKYRKDGTLAYEAPYIKDQPCVGLKEYLLDGTLKTTYPKIVVTPIDKMLTDQVFIIQLSLNEEIHRVEYFEGKLTDGQYIGDDADVLYPVKKGVLRIEQFVPEGGFVMKQMHFIAKIKTPQGNYYITEAHYNMAAENR